MSLTNMSLDNTSHLGRPGSDELVPSRYALRVGEIDVLVVSDGVLPLPTATLATNATPADLATWLEQNFLPPDRLDWPLNVLVARSGDQTILIDAGLGGQFSGFPRAGQFPQRLEAAGIDLESVTDVVITHMPHGPRWRAARRQGEEPASPGRANSRVRRRSQILDVARFRPHCHAEAGSGSAPFDCHELL